MAMKDEMAKAQKAASDSLAELWEQFQKAIHETSEAEPCSITVKVSFKPGKETEKVSRPPTLEVVGRASVASNRMRFQAKDTGGQLHLSGWAA